MHYLFPLIFIAYENTSIPYENTIIPLQGLKDKITYLLFTLSVSDLLTLLSATAIRLTCYLRHVDAIMTQNMIIIMTFTVYFVVNLNSSMSQVLMAIISVDRCITVTFPFLARRLSRLR